MDLDRVVLQTNYTEGDDCPLCEAMNRLSEDPTVEAALARLDINAAEAHAILGTNEAINTRAGRAGVFLVGVMLGVQLERSRCGVT